MIQGEKGPRTGCPINWVRPPDLRLGNLNLAKYFLLCVFDPSQWDVSGLKPR